MLFWLKGKQMTDQQRGGLVLGALIVLGIIAWNVFTSVKESISPSCYSQITQCKDNEDVANNFEGIKTAQWRCRLMADKLANYGSPEWPAWGAFTSFSTGSDFPSRNAVTLLDNDVRFENGFGAKERTPLRCEYDFASGTAVVTAR